MIFSHIQSVGVPDEDLMYWGGLGQQKPKIYLAAVVVHHPELDKFAGCTAAAVCSWLART